MATLNRENYAELLWVNYSKLIGEGYKLKPEQFSKVFKVLKSDKAYEKFMHMVTLPPWKRNTEGNTFNESEKAMGAEVTIYMHRYDNSFTVTHEYYEDNKAQAMGGRGVDGDARSLGDGLRKVLEMESARIINEGFDNVGYDGTSLFSEAHPLAGSTDTVSNRAPAGESAMTNENMEKAFTKIKKQKDEAGYLLQVMPDKLVVSSDLYFQALRVFNSAQVAGSELNDKNALPNVNIIAMDYLANGIWFLQDSSYENLVFFWREKPKFGYERIPKTMDYSYYGYARFGTGYLNWRGLYGAKIA